MLTRVYLDQWVWIRLARAALGRPTEPRDADVLALVRESARLGLASYPLSPTHYKELTAGASPRQSHELAPVIAEISRHHTMIGPGNDVLSEELDRYFQRRFGRPGTVREVQVFGQGIGHAFGEGDRFRPRLVGDDGGLPPVAPGVRHQLEDLAAEVTEYFMLAGPPEGVALPGYEPRAHTVYDRQFVEQESELARHLATMPRAKVRDIMYARAFVGDVFPLLEPALRHAGLPPTVLPLGDKKAATAMLRELPTLWAITELKRLQHENPARPWVPQDHGDLIAMTMAIVHCDIVVFDKHWSAMARRAGLDVANGTILCRLHELPARLMTAAA
jgi:hypothetical protein